MIDFTKPKKKNTHTNTHDLVLGENVPVSQWAQGTGSRDTKKNFIPPAKQTRLTTRAVASAPGYP